MTPPKKFVVKFKFEKKKKKSCDKEPLFANRKTKPPDTRYLTGRRSEGSMKQRDGG